MGEHFSVSRRTLLKSGGFTGALTLAGCVGSNEPDPPGSLYVEWESDTAVEYDGNHHAMASVIVDGKPIVGIPRNDLDESPNCGVTAIDRDGEVRWQDALPPEHCNAHAIGDVGTGDLDGNGRPEFLTATETAGVAAFDAISGEKTFEADLLESIGFSAPVVGDFTNDNSRELAAVDFIGNLVVVRPDGSVVWTQELDRPVHVTPIVGDLTDDGSVNLAVNTGRLPSRITCFHGDGEVAWEAEQEDAALTWTLVERQAGLAIASASRDTVHLIDGKNGDSVWSTTIGDDLRRVQVGAADKSHVYVSAPDGTVRALSHDSGEVEWMSHVTDSEARMVAPATGAITSDDQLAVAAATRDGLVVVLDAESGDLLARGDVASDLYSAPISTDVTGDGRDEVLVLYGDGRVAALSYSEGDTTGISS